MRHRLECRQQRGKPGGNLRPATSREIAHRSWFTVIEGAGRNKGAPGHVAAGGIAPRDCCAMNANADTRVTTPPGKAVGECERSERARVVLRESG